MIARDDGRRRSFLICFFVFSVEFCNFFFRRIGNRGIEDFDVQSFRNLFGFVRRKTGSIQVYMYGISPFLIKKVEILLCIITVDIVGIFLSEDVYAHPLYLDRFDIAVFVDRYLK